MDIKVLLQAIPFEIERSFCKHINKILKRRPSSKPFLSGDTFREFADVLYDETHKCVAADIKEGSVVFVSSWLLEDFITDIVPQIQNKFILLTHQGDVNIVPKEDYQQLAETETLIHWFAQNCTLEHKKVTPLPIGLEDARRFNAGHLRDLKKLSNKTNVKKEAKVVVAFTMGTNPEARFECYRSFWHKDITLDLPGYLNCRQYRKKLQECMFVASPEGNGLDCHRMWEALYLGVVPIVKRDPMTTYFESLNLPIWVIDKWDEVSVLSQETLSQKYTEIMLKSKTDAAYFDFCKEKIVE